MPTNIGPRVRLDDGRELPAYVMLGSNGGDVGSSTATASGSYQQVTGLSTVKQLTVPADATSATVVASGQAVRWRADGTAPTATVGMPLAVGGVLKLYGTDMAAARFIEQAASATLDVTYSK